MKKILLITAAAFTFMGCTPQNTPEPTKACVSAQQLDTYSYQALSNIATLLREDKKNIDAFDGFMGAMKLTVNSYSEMIKSSVYISNVVKFLPIPYAGEISNTTKLISKTALDLNGASESLDRYKKSSASFLESFSKLDPKNASSTELAKLATFADTKLLKDAQDLELSLHKISDSTAMMAATTQSISDALDTTGNYLNHAKSLVGFSQDQSASSTDKTKVTQNKNSINTKMAQLNQKIASLQHSADSYRLNIEKARIYSDLSVGLSILQ
jgi:hypothetical protein